ncbi:TonB-dependent hemoglobin/transferrin/lactoferrin family receptor [Mesorhizobium xinjiangense]|uniref:TonB-dependent hemoglobin/transferrin/lactoferrin family receptor n=1 Tax=Mesorhizobium xinjiangense TaxID=2678685 RepID=UPI0012ED4DC5|nr:TonB-dependent hemoglobin/transferrin/lactoferrin family receptor [Mesorhizobium xinjiangense]
MLANSVWRRRLLCSTATLLVAVGAGNTATAQEGATQLDRLTVEAASDPDRTVLTTTVEKEELDRRMVDDIDDLSRRIDAGVNFNSNNNSINLRGLDQNRVLTTIDGIRVPWLTDPRDSAQGGLNAFDFDTISTIDITRGADSTHYGSGVLGGVVSFRTLDPEDLLTGGRRFGSLVKGAYDSADQSWRTNAAVAGRVNDTYVLIQGSYRAGHETDNFGTIGGYGSDRTEANPLDYDQGNLLVKIHQYVGDGHRFGITGELFERDADIDDRIGTSSSYQPGSLKSGDDVKRQRLSATYDFLSPDGADWVDRAHVTAYWMRQQLNKTTDGFRFRDSRADIIPGDPFFYGYPSGVYKRDNELEQTSYGVTGNTSKEMELGGLSHNLRFGSEIYRQDTHQYSSGVDSCPDVDWTTVPDFFGPQSCKFLHSNASDMPDVESLFFGMFVEDDIALPNNITLTPGIRFDWYEHNPNSTAAYERGPNFDGTLPPSNSDARVSGKMRAAWQATDNLELYAQWAQAFRAPSALELYQNYGQPGSYARVGNPNLNPETSNGFELGARYEAAAYGASVSLFNNYYRNFIDQVQIAPPGGEYPIGGVIGYENRDRVQIYGAELSGYWNFAPNWRTWGSFAWSHGKDTDTDEYLNSIPPLRAIVGLGYNTENWGADVSLTMAAARDKVSDGGFKAPGYGIVDVTGWWEPEQLNGLRIQAGVFNVLDKKYWNALDVPDNTSDDVRDRYSEAGRAFRITISQRF